MEAALRALTNEGPDVTMTRIAEVAGYSIGTVYQYFPERTTLLCELMHQEAEANAAAVFEFVPAFHTLPLRDGIRGVLSILVQRVSDNRVLSALVLRELQPTLAADAFEDLTPRFAELLGQQLRLKGDQVRACDLRRAATNVLHSVEALVHRAVLDEPDQLDDPVFLDELVALVVGYLQPVGGSSVSPPAADPD